MDKRGIELSTLIAIILLIIALGILAFFITNLGFNQRADREACHTSIVMRGTISSIPGLDAAKSAVPLKCKEKKVCLTSSLFGSCNEFKGEKGITRVIVKNKEGIEKTIADEILECWSMTGQGRLDLFSEFLATRFGLGKIHSSCLICTRIAIDDNLKEKIKNKEYNIDIANYMATHAVPNQAISYFKYMLGEDISANDLAKLSIDDSLRNLNLADFNSDISNIAKDLKCEELNGVICNPNQICNGISIKTKDSLSCCINGECQTSSNQQTQLNQQTTDLSYIPSLSEDTSSEKESRIIQENEKNNEKIELPRWEGEEIAILFMQISAPNGAQSLLNIAKIGIATGAGGFLVAPTATTRITLSCILNPYCLFSMVILGAGQQGWIAYNRHIAAGYCGDVSHGSETRNGCSVVRVVKYNPEMINKYCSGSIESIP